MTGYLVTSISPRLSGRASSDPRYSVYRESPRVRRPFVHLAGTVEPSRPLVIIRSFLSTVLSPGRCARGNAHLTSEARSTHPENRVERKTTTPTTPRAGAFHASAKEARALAGYYPAVRTIRLSSVRERSAELILFSPR